MVRRFYLIGILASAWCVARTSTGCMSGATPDCDAGDSGCGPGFDGPPQEGSIDADVAADAPDGIGAADATEG
jgi:hypothetical protein